MPATELDPVVPDDVATALHRAAAAVPTAELHHTGPLLRLRARRQRRRIGAAAGGLAAAAVVVLVAGLASPDGDQVLVGDDTTAPGDPSSPSPTSSSGAGGLDKPLVMGKMGVEWLPDGTTAELPRARPDDLVTDAIRLTDGRLVTLATRDLQPGVARTDGAFAEGLAYVMAVFDAQGALLGENDVRRPGGYVSFAGEVDGRVALARTQAAGNCCEMQPFVEVSTVDPVTFTETDLTRLDGLLGPVDVRAGRVVVAADNAMGDPAGAADRCSLGVVDLDTGATSSVDLPPCAGARAVSVSPDGRRAAVTTDASAAGDDAAARAGGLDLHVVDLESHKVLSSRPLDLPGHCRGDDMRLCGKTEHRGLVWSDDGTLEAVVQDPEPGPNPVVDVGRLTTQRLRVVTVEVDGQS